MGLLQKIYSQRKDWNWVNNIQFQLDIKISVLVDRIITHSVETLIRVQEKNYFTIRRKV